MTPLDLAGTHDRERKAVVVRAAEADAPGSRQQPFFQAKFRAIGQARFTQGLLKHLRLRRVKSRLKRGQRFFENLPRFGVFAQLPTGCGNAEQRAAIIRRLLPCAGLRFDGLADAPGFEVNMNQAVQRGAKIRVNPQGVAQFFLRQIIAALPQIDQRDFAENARLVGHVAEVKTLIILLERKVVFLLLAVRSPQ